MGKKSQKKLTEAVRFIQKQFETVPEIGIVLGSGLGEFTKEIMVEKEVDYSDIPNFPVSTVKGHSGKLVFGKLSGKNVVAMAGRFHSYEGYDADEIVFPIRVMKLLGIHTLLLSNAAGAVNSTYQVGDFMIIRDHISFFMTNPLLGKNMDDLGPRFPDMSEPYSKDLIRKAHAVAAAHDYNIKEGVYVAVTGPTYETRAEYKMIFMMGADVVGMSTIQETIAARHMGLNVFAVSVITDIGLQSGEHKITHEEVVEAARATEPKLAVIFRELVAAI